MKLKLIIILALMFSLVLFGCAREKTQEQLITNEPISSEQPISVGNASFLNEVANLMVNSTNNSANSSE